MALLVHQSSQQLVDNMPRCLMIMILVIIYLFIWCNQKDEIYKMTLRNIMFISVNL